MPALIFAAAAALVMGVIKKCGPRDPQPRLTKKQQDL